MTNLSTIGLEAVLKRLDDIRRKADRARIAAAAHNREMIKSDSLTAAITTLDQVKAILEDGRIKWSDGRPKRGSPEMARLGQYRANCLSDFYRLIEELRQFMAEYKPEVLAACDRYYMVNVLEVDLDLAETDHSLDGMRDLYTKLARLINGRIDALEADMDLTLVDFFGGGPMYGDIPYIVKQLEELREFHKAVTLDRETFFFPGPGDYAPYLTS